MLAIININRMIIELLTIVIFTVLALQTAYAGGGDDKNKNEIIVSADGIAKIVDSNGKISLSPGDRNIEKGEIKFGGILTGVSIFKVNNVNRYKSHLRGGKVCVNNNLKTDSRNFYIHPYDDENQHNYCLVEIK